MANLMDSTPYNGNTPNQQSIEMLIQQIKQNPQVFEEQIRKTNPQAYQMALQIRNSPNPQAMIMQMMQAKGMNPNILRMLGLK